MRKFKTESQKLLDLMINSIYTNKEIFLRELISNASDAIDKLYFRSLTDQDVQLGADELRIFVAGDEEARTVTVSDSGIGMDGDELEHNLGTIAHSGSLEFRNENSESQGSDIDIIGQFGVGFYSAFMVAKKVRVVSKPYGSDKAWVWESDGIKGYTISEGEKETHGTDVILFLKDDTEEDDYTNFANEYRLRRLITQYSNYVRYPIQMEVHKSRPLPKAEDAPENEPPKYERYTEIETINSMIPIWKRNKSEVTDEDYSSFYKSDFHDFEDPARTFSIHAEGTLSYDALLFIPAHAPWDLYSKDYKKGLALYSSGVLIQEKCEDVIPDCFNFVRGIVDSEDLHLNISRETLQQNSQLRAIERKIEKKVKAELADMRDNDRETYEKIFEDFGRSMKFAIYESYGAQRELLGDLLMFYSAKQGKMITLDEYVEAKVTDQDAIYYMAGESTEMLSKMPVVTSVTDRGYDVLLCTQEVDEFCFMALGQYKDLALKNVATDDLGLATDADKDAVKEAVEGNSDLLAAMKEALGDKVAEVTISARPTDVPALIVAQGPISLDMERRYAMTAGAEDVKSTRVLELNAEHPVFTALHDAFAAGDTAKVETYTKILHDQALLVAGLPIEDPVAYAKAVSDLMK